MNGITKFYLLHHDEARLNACPAPDDAIRVHLPRLNIPVPFRINALAESRFLLWCALHPDDALPPNGAVAVFQASYPEKFPLLPPLAELTAPPPGVGYGPVLCQHYHNQARHCHPGLDLALDRILRPVGVSEAEGFPAPMTNSFIVDSDVLRAFLPTWLRLFLNAIDEYNPPRFDVSRCKPEVLPAYLLERLTTAYFASRAEPVWQPITNAAGECYYAEGDIPGDRRSNVGERVAVCDGSYVIDDTRRGIDWGNGLVDTGEGELVNNPLRSGF